MDGKNDRAPQLLLLYSDSHIAVCVKPAGIDAQNGVPEMLRAQLGGDAYCVHRLDREVGGVMVYARTAAAAASLGKAITEGRMEKAYLAVCAGRPAADSGTMRDLLFHDTQRNKSFVVTRQRRGVREAILDYQLLGCLEDCALVRVLLHTGRTHQIRIQFASRGMPLLGDRTYGSRRKDCGIALWSAALGFPHPFSREFLRFCAPPPDTAPWQFFDTRGDLNA